MRGSSNFKIEVQWGKPQAQDQSNKEQNNKDFNDNLIHLWRSKSIAYHVNCITYEIFMPQCMNIDQIDTFIAHTLTKWYLRVHNSWFFNAN